MAVAQRMTAAQEYLALPEQRWTELVEGELVVAQPRIEHQAAVVLGYRRSTPASGTFDVSLELARGDVLASPLLPGFALTLDELLAS